MKHLRILILTLLATGMTVIIMPALTMFRQPTPKPVFLTQVKTLAWTPERIPPKTPRLEPLTEKPQEPHAPQRKPRTTMTVPHPQPHSPTIPPARLTVPDNNVKLNLPPVSESLDFPLEKMPASLTDLPPSNNLNAPHDTGDNPEEQAEEGAAAPTSAHLPPQDSPLIEKQICTPNWPRNTIPVTGSLELEFTVRTDGSVTDILVIRCDSQLSFKYRREAIRAAQQSTYYPPQRKGKPFPIRARRTIHFTIP